MATSFLSSALKTTLSRALGAGQPGFPYQIGERDTTYNGLWSLHNGVKREDNSAVSIFVFDCVKQKDKLPLAKNAFKRFRTIRHPEVLRYIDGLETDSNIYIATDPVTPLSTQLEATKDPAFIAFGLYKLATAIRFLNVDCNLIHGNIRISSVFTNKAGEWKLGGFELLGSLKEDSAPLLTYFSILPDFGRYAPPEVRKASIHIIKELPTQAMDVWQYGCLIYEAYNGYLSSPDQLMTRGAIPQNLYQKYLGLVDQNGSQRMNIGIFIEQGTQPSSYFGTELVAVNDFLENLNIKEQREKDAFFRKLGADIDKFPSGYCKYKILPELVKALEYGAGGSKALFTLLRIGTTLTGDEYEQLFLSSIVKMFASPDRAIRMCLLEQLGTFVDKLDKKTVVDKIFPHVALGFGDAAPPLREATVKSVLLLIPMLSERLINNDLLRYLAKLQMDAEPGIRTNTTICLGKIAKFLLESTQKKVLVAAFARSLRDPFYHARVAALMAYVATADLIEVQEIAQKVVPNVASVLLDNEKPVRTQAFKTLEILIKRLEKAADAMPDTALPVPPAVGVSGVATNGNSNSRPSSASKATTAVEGWAGWAVSSITSKLSQVALDDGSSNNLSGQITPAAIIPTPSNAPATSHNVQSTGTTFGPNAQPNNLSATIDGWGDEDFDAAPMASQHKNLMDDEDTSGWEPFDIPDASFQATRVEPPRVPSPASGPMKLGGSGSLGSPLTVHPTSSASSYFANPPGNSLPGIDLNNSWTSDAITSSGFPNDVVATSASVGFDPPGMELGWGAEDLSPARSPNLGMMSGLSREDKQAELRRKREERRQRMNEAKEKKKAGALGARPI